MNTALIRRKDVHLLKTAYHRAGVKRLPTLSALASRGIIKPLGRGQYKLARRPKNGGMV